MATLSFLCSSQEVTNGRQPRSIQSLYTIPHRLTVAGDATARSSTSNSRVTCERGGGGGMKVALSCMIL